MQGAVCITSNRGVREALSIYGFTVEKPRADRVDYSVRLPIEMARMVDKTARQYKTHNATVIRYAVKRWVEDGCPYLGKKK